MIHKASKMALLALFISLPGIADARFNTIRKKENLGYEILTKGKEISLTVDTLRVDSVRLQNEPLTATPDSTVEETPDTGQNGVLRKKHLGLDVEIKGETPKREEYLQKAYYETLPELTISNLLDEIRRIGIRHEKIVLAQAILETGWFTSYTCRHKNNLFGLTNPRTGQYYEFNHWTESVKAYFTKVQYRYKGGNYLLWLKDIGYAEDPRYVSSLISILRQYMI